MRKLKNKELDRISVEAYKESEKTPIVLVLDNVRSALNIGSAFRTADAFRIEKIILCGITAQPPHRDIQKTALGATESVDWEYHANIIDIVKALKAQNHTIYAIEQANQKIWLQDVETQKEAKYALIFGNEVKGVSEEILPFCSNCIEIPQFGTKHSLNISVSIGVVLWDFFVKLAK